MLYTIHYYTPYQGEDSFYAPLPKLRSYPVEADSADEAFDKFDDFFKGTLEIVDVTEGDAKWCNHS